MSATDGFADLEYSDYPTVDSDDRSNFRDVKEEDIPYINEYELLMTAVKSATSEAERSTAWINLTNFRATDGYKQHVDPVILNALKMQRLEDCILACQRLAKRQAQQWVISDSQPSLIEQAVGDIWFKRNGVNSEGITMHLMYERTNNGYRKMAVQNPGFKITEVTTASSLPSDADEHPTTLYLITE